MINSYFGKLKNFVSKSEDPFTAEKAWVETTYGQGSYKPIEDRILEKQKSIKRAIQGKFENYTNNDHFCKSYRCVIDFEEDLKNYIKEVLQPFYDGGFDIINLSEQIEEIKDENVYLISWRHIFDKQIKSTDNSKEVMICD